MKAMPGELPEVLVLELRVFGDFPEAGGDICVKKGDDWAIE